MIAIAVQEGEVLLSNRRRWEPDVASANRSARDEGGTAAMSGPINHSEFVRALRGAGQRTLRRSRRNDEGNSLLRQASTRVYPDVSVREAVRRLTAID
jgi:hypothetical protein